MFVDAGWLSLSWLVEALVIAVGLIVTFYPTFYVFPEGRTDNRAGDHTARRRRGTDDGP